MEIMFFPCSCGMNRGTEPMPYFRRFSLGPCLKCGAPFSGIRIPFFGVWRIS